jgi:hypothetical protein
MILLFKSGEGDFQLDSFYKLQFNLLHCFFGADYNSCYMAHAPGGPARPNKGPSKGPPESYHLSQGPGIKEKVTIAVVEERYRVI